MIKSILINFIGHHVFNLVTVKDILREDKGHNLYYKGQKLTSEQKQALIESAKQLEDNYFFKMLMDDMEYEVSKRINQSKTMEGFRASKAALWTIDLIKKKVDNISSKGH